MIDLGTSVAMLPTYGAELCIQINAVLFRSAAVAMGSYTLHLRPFFSILDSFKTIPYEDYKGWPYG